MIVLLLWLALQVPCGEAGGLPWYMERFGSIPAEPAPCPSDAPPPIETPALTERVWMPVVANGAG